MSIVTIWNFCGTKWRASLGCKSSEMENVTWLQLEQRHVVKVLYIKASNLTKLPWNFPKLMAGVHAPLRA
jgi:hypothetical protein